MESQPQDPEFTNNPENFFFTGQCPTLVGRGLGILPLVIWVLEAN